MPSLPNAALHWLDRPEEALIAAGVLSALAPAGGYHSLWGTLLLVLGG
jgi:hypothetical protein